MEKKKDCLYAGDEKDFRTIREWEIYGHGEKPVEVESAEDRRIDSVIKCLRDKKVI